MATADVAGVLPAAAVAVSVSASTGTSEGVHGGFAVESAALSLQRVAVDTYDYDAAGRMTMRTADSVTTALGWDPLSNLTSTSSLADSRIYAYDASGQRVAQIVVNAVAANPVASKVTAYVGDLEVTDADGLANTSGLSATRFLTFGGATVATVTSGSPTPTWSLMLGDGQGSAQVAMELVPVAAGTGLAPASSTHAVTRNAYMPFGATRGGDNLATSRGWLGQVADTDTGLIYLNARYYDPVLARFVSPDPLMNPGDPKTLDPYRYADNNPVMMTDASGLAPCAGTGVYEQKCLDAYNRGMGTSQTKPSNATFTKKFVTGVWKNLLGDAVNALGPVMAFKSTKLLVTDPKGFGNQYVQIWHGVTHYASDWGSQVHTGWKVVNGDASVGNYFSQLWHSDMAFNLGDDFDAKDGDAAARDYTTALETVGGGVVFKGGLGPARAGAADGAAGVLATPQVASPKLQNIVNDLYKGTTNPVRVGSGTTMDAIANELATGIPTNGKFHSIKGQDYLNGLNNWLERNPSAPYQDRLVAQSLADEMSKSLGGAG